MSRPSRRGIVLAVAALAVIATILAVAALARGAAGHRSPTPTASPSETQAQAAAPTPAATGPNQKEAAEAAASSFARALASQSWQDASPSTWVQRAAQYATPQYGAELRRLYTGDTAAGWSDFVAAHTVRSARVDYSDAQLTGPADGYVAVRYRVSTASDASSDGTADEQLSKLLTVKLVEGRWLVDGMSEIASGYAPATPGPTTAPPQAPTVRD